MADLDSMMPEAEKESNPVADGSNPEVDKESNPEGDEESKPEGDEESKQDADKEESKPESDDESLPEFDHRIKGLGSAEIRENVFYCNVCNHTMLSRQLYEQHIKGRQHMRTLNTVNQLNGLAKDKIPPLLTSKESNTAPDTGFYCKVCNLTMLDENLFDQHIRGKRHAKNEHIANPNPEQKCKIFVYGLRGMDFKEKFLASYFINFGAIRRIQNCQPDFAYVTFEEQKSARLAVKFTRHQHMGYSFTVRRYEVKESSVLPEYIKEANSRQELKRHRNITKLLMEAESISQQFHVIINDFQLTKSDLKAREEIIRSLNKLTSSYFEYAKIWKLGSSINGFGVQGCDLDLYLDFHRHRKQIGTKKLVFPLPFRTSEGKSLTHAPILLTVVEKMTDIEKLKFLESILGTDKIQFGHVSVIPSKRCPLIRFIHRRTGVQCDLSINNKAGFYNSHLLWLYSREPRVHRLVVVIRYWAKLRKMTNSDNNKAWFSSYALTWLVLFYLMQREPKVIPLVKDLQTHIGKGIYMHKVKTHKCWLIQQSVKLPPSPNVETDVQLLHGFFQFYSQEIDWSSQALLTFEGEAVPRGQLLKEPYNLDSSQDWPMNIIDPYILSHNIVGNVNETGRLRFMEEVEQAAKITENWLVNDSSSEAPNLKTEPWGLAEILQVFEKPKAQSVFPRGDIKVIQLKDETEDGMFGMSLYPEFEPSTNEELVQLSKENAMEPLAMWCSLVQKMVLDVYESVFLLNMKEESFVEDWSATEAGAETDDAMDTLGTAGDDPVLDDDDDRSISDGCSDIISGNYRHSDNESGEEPLQLDVAPKRPGQILEGISIKKLKLEEETNVETGERREENVKLEGNVENTEAQFCRERMEDLDIMQEAGTTDVVMSALKETPRQDTSWERHKGTLESVGKSPGMLLPQSSPGNGVEDGAEVSSSSQNTSFVITDQDMKQHFDGDRSVRKVWSYSCVCTKHVWQQRGCIANGFGNENLKGVERERVITKRVVEYFERRDADDKNRNPNILGARARGRKKRRVCRPRAVFDFSCRIIENYDLVEANPDARPCITILMRTGNDYRFKLREFFTSSRRMVDRLVTQHLLKSLDVPPTTLPTSSTTATSTASTTTTSTTATATATTISQTGDGPMELEKGQ